jgi:hypothetical protein
MLLVPSQLIGMTAILIGSVLGSLQTFAVMADDALSDDGGLLVLLLLSLQPASKHTVKTAVKIRHKALL